ncbi:MAG: HalOD1 output domain-containing protein [Halodesulfurarchaeum sp.]
MMTRDLDAQRVARHTFADLGLIDRVGHDPVTDTFHAQHDSQRDDSIVATVVETVATATGDPPDDLRAMYSVLDPDALEAILATDGESHVEVEFLYEGRSVTVTSDGDVVVA